MILYNIVILAFYLFSMIGLGYFFSGGKFKYSDANALITLALNFYFGIGIWYLFANVLSLYGYFTRTTVLTLLLIPLFFTWKLFRGSFPHLKKIFLSFRRSVLKESFSVIAFLIFAIFLVLNGLSGIGKSIIGDATAFYFNIAKTLSYSGILVPLPGYEDFSAVGLLGEFHISTLLLFNAEDAARSASYFVFLPSVFLLFVWTRLLGASLVAQIFTVISVFGSTAVCYLFGDGKTDLYSAALSVTAYYLIVFRSNYLLTGLMLGFACVAKISLMISMGPGIAIILFIKSLKENNNGFLRFLKNLILKNMMVGLPFILVMGTHMFKNYKILNNAFAPFNNNKLVWDSAWFSTETIIRIKYLYPFVWFFGNFWAQYGNLSILILTFLPFAFSKATINVRKWSNLELTFIAGLSGLIAWLVMNPSFVAPRYILGTLLIFVPVSMVGLSNFLNCFSVQKYQKYFALSFLLVLAIFARSEQRESDLAWSNVSKYMRNINKPCLRDGLHCKASLAINESAPLGARVLNYNYYTYWLRTDLIQVMSSSAEKNTLPSNNPEENWKSYYKWGFDYILIDRGTHSAIVKQLDLESLPSWITLEKLFEKENLLAFKILYDKAMVQEWPRLIVLNRKNIWAVQR